MLPVNIHETAKKVSSCLQLAILLEVSAHKPGNVSRTARFQGTRYEHFLASAVAVKPSFTLAAQRGILVSIGKIDLKSIHMGKIIRDAVTNVNAWQHGGNTLLGTVLVLSPIAVAAGMTLTEKMDFSVSKLRANIRQVVESTLPSDAVEVYEAIKIAKPNGLKNKVQTLDVNDLKSKKKILEENVTLYDIFKISSSYDSISREWVEDYPLTFDLGLPIFTEQLRETDDLNTAIVHTFLKILAAVPDSLIIRKAGMEKAEEVSRRAEEVLSLGGLATSVGKEKLVSFDEYLRGSANLCNPGTTADIVAAVLAVSVLKGYRP